MSAKWIVVSVFLALTALLAWGAFAGQSEHLRGNALLIHTGAGLVWLVLLVMMAFLFRAASAARRFGATANVLGWLALILATLSSVQIVAPFVVPMDYDTQQAAVRSHGLSAAWFIGILVACVVAVSVARKQETN